MARIETCCLNRLRRTLKMWLTARTGASFTGRSVFVERPVPMRVGHGVDLGPARYPRPSGPAHDQRPQPRQECNGRSVCAAEFGKTFCRMKPGDPGGDRVDQTDGEFERGPTDAVKGEFSERGDEAADEEAR